MPVSIQVAVDIGDLHDIQIPVADKVLLATVLIDLPHHAGPIDLKPQEMVLEELFVPWIIHPRLDRVEIIYRSFLFIVAFFAHPVLVVSLIQNTLC